MTAVVESPAAPASARPGRHRPSAPRRTVAARILSGLATLLVVVTGLVLLGMTVGPRVFGYRTATMLTGSMTPTIRPGDVIVDVREKASELAVGQIITYHVPVEDHRVESHRVTWVGRDKDGAVVFRTKGDANNGEDPWTARADTTQVWRVRTVLPVAGDVIRFLRQPIVQLALTRVLPAVLIASVLFAIWRPSRRDGEAS